jgi:hypothetical protein
MTNDKNLEGILVVGPKYFNYVAPPADSKQPTKRKNQSGGVNLDGGVTNVQGSLSGRDSTDGPSPVNFNYITKVIYENGAVPILFSQTADVKYNIVFMTTPEDKIEIKKKDGTPFSATLESKTLELPAGEYEVVVPVTRIIRLQTDNATINVLYAGTPLGPGDLYMDTKLEQKLTHLRVIGSGNTITASNNLNGHVVCNTDVNKVSYVKR